MRRGFITAFACAALLSGCGFADAPGTPRTAAHRLGAGNWPENSRLALRESLARGYPALEFDLGLTKDRIPVLAHDATLNPTQCTRADGSRLAQGERLFIKDLTLEELRAGFRCGGLPHPERPTAAVLAETHLTLDEMLDELKGHPAPLLVFDVKYIPGKTLPAEAFAEEILGRWSAAALPNPWLMTAGSPEFIRAAAARGVRDISLIWPEFPEGANTTLVAAANELTSQLGVNDPIALVKNAGGNGLNMPYQVIDRRVVEHARLNGMTVKVYTVNEPKLLQAYCRWPLDVIFTDYPERSPCP